MLFWVTTPSVRVKTRKAIFTCGRVARRRCVISLPLDAPRPAESGDLDASVVASGASDEAAAPRFSSAATATHMPTHQAPDAASMAKPRGLCCKGRVGGPDAGSDERWCERIAASWERAPTAIPAPSTPVLEADEAYAAIVAASERPSRSRLFFNHEVAPRRFTRQGSRPVDPAHLPRPGDRSLEGYAARLDAQLGGARFCLRVTDLHLHAPRFAERLTALLERLLPRLPARRRRTDVVFFVGNYVFTPAGVHTDLGPVLQGIVLGAKTGWFWAPHVWESEARDPSDPERSRADSTRISLGLGEWVLWPTGQYHVFESAGLSAGISIGLPEELAEASPSPERPQEGA